MRLVDYFFVNRRKAATSRCWYNILNQWYTSFSCNWKICHFFRWLYLSWNYMDMSCLACTNTRVYHSGPLVIFNSGSQFHIDELLFDPFKGRSSHLLVLFRSWRLVGFSLFFLSAVPNIYGGRSKRNFRGRVRGSLSLSAYQFPRYQ